MDAGQVMQHGVPPTARLQRVASGAQVTAIAAWWAAQPQATQVAHGLQIEQFPDSWLAQQVGSWPPALQLHPVNRVL